MRKLFVATFLLLSLACKAQLTRYKLDFTLSKKEFVDTIDIAYERNQILVPVVINGQTYRFLLDTGASQTTIYDDVAIEGTTAAGYTTSHDALSARNTVSRVSMPPMTLGSVTFTGCKAIVQNRIVRSRNSIDGIIGFDIVCKGLNAKIDLRNRQLILSDIFDFFEKEPAVTMKYKLDLHVPYVEVCPFGKYRERVLIDTGSRQFYSMNKSSFDQGVACAKEDVGSQIESRTMGRYAIGHGGVEQRGEVVFLRLSNFLFGKFAFQNLRALTTQGGSHLGVQLLEYGALTFNPKRLRLRFQPYDAAQSTSVDNQLFEKAIIPDNGRPVVGLIRDGSEPYKAGLREGDTIIMIDQKGMNTFADYLRFRPIIGNTHTFIVRDRQGNIKEVNTTW